MLILSLEYDLDSPQLFPFNIETGTEKVLHLFGRISIKIPVFY
jgi:hypothetical protein